jgi:hypothetical protein
MWVLAAYGQPAAAHRYVTKALALADGASDERCAVLGLSLCRPHCPRRSVCLENSKLAGLCRTRSRRGLRASRCRCKPACGTRWQRISPRPNS